MELKITRRIFETEYTIGSFYTNEKYLCDCLEDRVRDGEKIDGQTAIPSGRYEVILDYSVRFKKTMPHILDVPGFEGIRIHAGNTDKDTEGCILLGTHTGGDFVKDSRAFMDVLMDILVRAVSRDEKVFISIT